MTPPFDPRRYQDPSTIQRVIHSAKTIAIVGLSKNELRASYFVGYYLKRHGYRVIPVNPREPEILVHLATAWAADQAPRTAAEILDRAERLGPSAELKLRIDALRASLAIR